MVAVDIANLALGYLGDTATVASLDPPEGSVQAQHCARFYPIALQILLEMHQWNFSTTRVKLAVVQTPFNSRWLYAYAQPSDATDIISVLPQETYYSSYAPSQFEDYESLWYWLDNLPYNYPFSFEQTYVRDFQVEILNGQQVILSNADTAVARYTSSKVQPGQFSGLFTDALAHLLASMLAGPLLKGDAGAAESKRQYQQFQIGANMAMGQDANQRKGNLQPVVDWIARR